MLPGLRSVRGRGYGVRNEKFHVDYWEAFILRYHEGLSMEDVAETLSVKPGAAKIRCIAVSQNCATSF